MRERALAAIAVVASIAAFSIVLAFADAAGDELTRRAVVPGLSGGGALAEPTVTPAATPSPTTAGTATLTATSTSTVSPTATSSPTSTPTSPSTAPTATPTATMVTGNAPVIGGCQVFPSNNPWNTDISSYPVDANSAGYLSAIAGLGGNQELHPDFGSFSGYGIPFVVVPQSQPDVPITFTAYGSQSDPGPYPVPADAPVEGGSESDGDRHVLVLQQGDCMLYELYYAFPSNGGWEAASGAVFDLGSNALRPEGWTSADAAGLPILPGLVKYDEVQSGSIHHAIRVTFSSTQKAYIHPATHWASDETGVNLPPMGLRLRLKAGYDISGFTGDARVILEAMKTYGVIVADNGSNWYFTGATDPRWDDDDLDQLKDVPGSAFEVVDTGEAIVTP